jgi:tRNA 2-thiouridine synthesizing protein E
MTNVEHNANYSPTGNTERAGREKDLAGWTDDWARQQAQQEGLELTDEHLRVLQFLRDFYLEQGWTKKAHELTQALDDAFEAEGGGQYLHRLFPDGPLAQGSRLAGLPEPAYAVDESFGSSH